MIDSPIVLVPGFGGAPEAELLASMLRRRRAVTVVELGALSDLAEAHDVIERAVDAAPAAPVIVGLGVGAVAALAWAAMSGHRAEGLVAVNAWLSPSPSLVAFARLWGGLRAEGSTLTGDVAAQLMADPQSDRALSPLAPTAQLDALVAVAATADLSPLASRVTGPVLIVGGAADAVAPCRQSRLLSAALPNARYAEVDGGHSLARDRPAELSALIDEFSEQPEAQPAGTTLARHRP